MSTRVHCPACQYQFDAAESAQRHICPNCQSPFAAKKTGTEPSAAAPPRQPALNKTMLGETAAPIVFNCPRCTKRLELAAIEAGTKRPCPECGQRLQVPAASAEVNLNKTILASDESSAPATGVRPGAPTAARASSTTSDASTPGGPAKSRPRSKSNYGLLIGGGLAVAALVFVLLIACVVSIFVFRSRGQATVDRLAFEAKQRIDQEEAARRAEREARQREQDALLRKMEEEQRDFAKLQAEAKVRQEKEDEELKAKALEQQKRFAEEQKALRDQLAKQANDLTKGKKGFIPGPPGLMEFNGVLTPGVGNPYRPGRFVKLHPHPMKAGRTYIISLFAQWDNYLHLEDPFGKHIVSDDDGGGYPHARIVFTCPADGAYRILVSSFGSGVTGPYTLKVTD